MQKLTKRMAAVEKSCTIPVPVLPVPSLKSKMNAIYIIWVHSSKRKLNSCKQFMERAFKVLKVRPEKENYHFYNSFLQPVLRTLGQRGIPSTKLERGILTLKFGYLSPQ